MAIGTMLRLYREYRHITLRQLAESIGVDFTTLSRFERGKSVNLKAWVAIIKWILTT